MNPYQEGTSRLMFGVHTLPQHFLPALPRGSPHIEYTAPLEGTLPPRPPPAPHPDRLWMAVLGPEVTGTHVPRMWLGCELVTTVAFPTHLCCCLWGPHMGWSPVPMDWLPALLPASCPQSWTQSHPWTEKKNHSVNE